MRKKVLSMVLIGALVLSASSVSQAATISKNTDEKSAQYGKYAAGEITVTSEQQVPTIAVTLSDVDNKKIAINPYGLEASVRGLPVGDPLQREQLVNKVETITNDSEVALAVNATVKATPANTKVKLATAEVKDTDTANSIFAYLQVDVGSNIDATKTYDTKAGNQVVFTSKETTKKAMVTLADKNRANKVAAFKIRGSVAKNPAQMWDSADTVDFSIVFDFEPRVLPD